MSKELEALKRIGELKVGCHYENGATLVVDFELPKHHKTIAILKESRV